MNNAQLTVRSSSAIVGTQSYVDSTCNATRASVQLENVVLFNASTWTVEPAVTVAVSNINVSIGSTWTLGQGTVVFAAAVFVTSASRLNLADGVTVAASNVTWGSAGASTTTVQQPGCIYLDTITVTTGVNATLRSDTCMWFNGSTSWKATGTLFLTTNGSMGVQPGVIIDASGGGYGSGVTPFGTRPYSSTLTSGGAHASCGSEPASNGAACSLTGVGRVYGSTFGPPSDYSATPIWGSGGMPGGGGLLGGAGGGAIVISAGYLELNGTLMADGVTLPDQYGPGYYTGAGGAGGSVYISVGTLGVSTGLVTSRGGGGAWNTWSNGYWGGGGSGGRVAINCLQHSYTSRMPVNGSVNSAALRWSDWLLRTNTMGGTSGRQPTTDAAGAGTVYIDCGAEYSRTIIVDNQVATRPASFRFSMVAEQAAAVTLREIRVLRGGHLRWPTPTGLRNNTVVSTQAITGDAYGQLTLSNRTALLLGAAVVGILPAVVEQEMTPVALLQSVDGSPSEFTVSQTRRFTIDDRGLSYATVGGTLVVDNGASLLLPPRVTVVGASFDIAGTVYGLTTLTLMNNAQLTVRSSSAIVGTQSYVDSTCNATRASVQLENVVLLNSSAWNVEPAMTVFVSNISISAGSTWTLGQAAVVMVSVASITSGSKLNLAGAVSITATNVAWAAAAATVAWYQQAGCIFMSDGLLIAGFNVTLRSDTCLLLNGSTNIKASGTFTVATSGSAYVQAGVLVDVSGGGYGTGVTPFGTRSYNASYTAGGSHASCEPASNGAACSPTGVGRVYGSTFGPPSDSSVTPIWGSGGMPGGGGLVSGAGGGAIIIGAGYLELNGTLMADGQTLAGQYTSGWASGGGAGGSVFVTTSTLGPSTGLMTARGGGGGWNTYSGSVTYSGGGGSGGRIALRCDQHSYGPGANATSLGWQNFQLRYNAMGGYTGGPTGVSFNGDLAGAGTVFVDCGKEFARTLIVDNQVTNRPAASRYSMVAEQAGAFTLRELRLLGGGHLLLPTPLDLGVTTVMTAQVVTGDGTGLLTVTNRTVVAFPTRPTGSSLAIIAAATIPPAGLLESPNAGSAYLQGNVSYQVSMLTDGTTVAPAQSSLVIDDGGLALLHPWLILRGRSLDVAGRLSGARNISVLDGGSLVVRSTACAADGGPVALDTIYVANNSVVSLGAGVRLVASQVILEGGSRLLVADSATLSITSLTLSTSFLSLGSNCSISATGGSSTNVDGAVSSTGLCYSAGCIVLQNSTITTAGDTTITAAAGLLLRGATTVRLMGSLSLQSDGDLVIAAGVVVDGSGGGYGSGAGRGSSPFVSGRQQPGGSYAGCSSDAPPTGCATAGPGAVYGSHDFWDKVVPLGSGGAPGFNSSGGNGGGAVSLSAAGTLVVDGSVLVDGGAGAVSASANFAGGGGSGGSVRIIAKTLGWSSGIISASGGAGATSSYTAAYNGLGGSGGRVVISAWSSAMGADIGTWPLQLQAFGGLAGEPSDAATAASAGTVFVSFPATLSPSTLVVRNRAGSLLRAVHVLAAGAARIIDAGNVVVGAGSRLLFSTVAGQGIFAFQNASGEGSGAALNLTGGVRAVIGKAASMQSSTQFLNAWQRQSTSSASDRGSLSWMQGLTVTVAGGAWLDIPGQLTVCNGTLQVASQGTVVAVKNVSQCGGGALPPVLVQSAGAVRGCTDPAALNAVNYATSSDPSLCAYGAGSHPTPATGCQASIAQNFDPAAKVDDGSCTLAPGLRPGCSSPCAVNYARSATLDDGSCSFSFAPLLRSRNNATWFAINATLDALAAQRNETARLQALLYAFLHVTPSSTVTASPTPSGSVSTSFSASESSTQSQSATPSWTASSTVSPSATVSQTASVSPTPSYTSSATPTASVSASPSGTLSPTTSSSASSTAAPSTPVKLAARFYAQSGGQDQALAPPQVPAAVVTLFSPVTRFIVSLAQGCIGASDVVIDCATTTTGVGVPVRSLAEAPVDRLRVFPPRIRLQRSPSDACLRWPSGGALFELYDARLFYDAAVALNRSLTKEPLLAQSFSLACRLTTGNGSPGAALLAVTRADALVLDATLLIPRDILVLRPAQSMLISTRDGRAVPLPDRWPSSATVAEVFGDSANASSWSRALGDAAARIASTPAGNSALQAAGTGALTVSGSTILVLTLDPRFLPSPTRSATNSTSSRKLTPFVSIGGVRANITWISPDGSQVHVLTPQFVDVCGASGSSRPGAGGSRSADCGYQTMSFGYLEVESAAHTRLLLSPPANRRQHPDGPLRASRGTGRGVLAVRALAVTSAWAWVSAWMTAAGTQSIAAEQEVLDGAALDQLLPAAPPTSCPPWCPHLLPGSVVPLAVPLEGSAPSFSLSDGMFQSTAIVPGVPLGSEATSAFAPLTASALHSAGLYYTQQCAGYTDFTSGACSNASHPDFHNCAWGTGDDCKPCMPNAFCAGGYRAQPWPGYYTPSEDSGEITPCPWPSLQRCLGWDASIGAVRCGRSYKPLSPSCASCDTGYFAKDDGTCGSCPSSSALGPLLRAALQLLGGLMAVFLVVFVVGVGIARVVGGTVAATISRSIDLLVWMVVVLQLLAQVGKAAVAGLPAELGVLFSSLAAFQFEGIALPSACWNAYAFRNEVAEMLAALVLVALIAALVLSGRHGGTQRAATNTASCKLPGCGRFGSAFASLSSMALRRRLLMLTFTTTTLLYATVTNTALRLVVCGTVQISQVAYAALNGSDGGAGTGSGTVSAFVLLNNPSFICYAPRGSHLPAACIAWATIVLVVVGYPVGSLLWVANRISKILRRRFLHNAAALAVAGAVPPLATSRAVKDALTTARDLSAIASSDTTVLLQVVAARHCRGFRSAAVVCWGRRCLVRSAHGSAQERSVQAPARQGARPASPSVAGLDSPGAAATLMPELKTASGLEHPTPKTATATQSNGASATAVTGAADRPPFYVAGLCYQLLADFSPDLSASISLQHFVGPAYRPSLFFARQADMGAIAAVAAFQALLVRPQTIAVAALRGGCIVMTLLGSAWFFATRNPFRIGEIWKLLVKVGSLCLAALGTVLTHVSLCWQMSEGDSATTTPIAVVVLSYAVLGGSALLFCTLMWGFWAGIVRGARGDEAADARNVAESRQNRFRGLGKHMRFGKPRPSLQGADSTQTGGSQGYAPGADLLNLRQNPLARVNSSAQGEGCFDATAATKPHSGVRQPPPTSFDCIGANARAAGDVPVAASFTPQTALILRGMQQPRLRRVVLGPEAEDVDTRGLRNAAFRSAAGGSIDASCLRSDVSETLARSTPPRADGRGLLRPRVMLRGLSSRLHPTPPASPNTRVSATPDARSSFQVAQIRHARAGGGGRKTAIAKTTAPPVSASGSSSALPAIAYAMRFATVFRQRDQARARVRKAVGNDVLQSR